MRTPTSSKRRFAVVAAAAVISGLLAAPGAVAAPGEKVGGRTGHTWDLSTTDGHARKGHTWDRTPQDPRP